MNRRDSFLPSADKPSAVCKAVQLKSATVDDFLHPTHLKISSHYTGKKHAAGCGLNVLKHTSVGKILLRMHMSNILRQENLLPYIGYLTLLVS